LVRGESLQYLIGDFSAISRLSITTLRYYHECGLLEPTFIDNDSGYRYYAESSLEKAEIITKLKNMDFTLKEIKEILDNCEDDTDLVESMVNKYDVIQKKIIKYDKVAKKLEAFIKASQEDQKRIPSNNKAIVTKTIEDTFIASIRFKGTYLQVPNCFDYLYSCCSSYLCGPHFSIYYDNYFKEEDADIECCVPIKAPIKNKDISNKFVSGGKALTIIHNGPYEFLGDSYKVLIDYANENRINFLSPFREIYVKGRSMVLPRKPENFLTELQMYIPAK
jgi:DNA-binding transcriptional MerR regulator